MVGFEKIRKYIVDDEFRLIFFDNQIYIINFDKILELSDGNITVNWENKLFVIKGDVLSLKRLLDKEVLISGKIKSIEVFYDK